MTGYPPAVDAALAGLLRSIRLVAFDFDGVFTDNAVYVHQDGSESVRCYRGDGIGLRQLERLGITPLILSSEPNPVVLARSRKLAVRCLHGLSDKRAALSAILEEMGLAPEQAAFVGNDVNDLPALTYVGLPMVVGDAHPAILAHARYRSQRPGGYGAVREICDLFQQVLSEGP